MIRVKPGDRLTKVMPYSEVCMHLRVAGQPMECVIQQNGDVQLYKDGREFSFPILDSEAGFYDDGEGLYCHGISFVSFNKEEENDED